MAAKLIYLLMQDDKILDASHAPTMLDGFKLDRARNWQILLAAECDGIRRIAKPIVSFRAQPEGTIYYLSSDLDGPFRMVGKTGDSVEMVAERIRVMYVNGRFTCNPGNILAGQDVKVGWVSLIEAINPIDLPKNSA